MIPEHVMRELRYIEVYTSKRIRNLRVGWTVDPDDFRGAIRSYTRYLVWIVDERSSCGLSVDQSVPQFEFRFCLETAS